MVVAAVAAIACLLATPATVLAVQQSDTMAVDLRVFTGRGCPHCARALVWVDDLLGRRPELRVEVLDVVEDPRALEELALLVRERGLGGGVTVPTFVVRGEEVHVGFGEAETTGRMLEGLLVERGAAAPIIDSVAVRPGDTSVIVSLPFFGTVSLGEVGLPAFTIALGLVDGFNPCAMWVLLFLISMLLHVPSRRRMVMVGGVFVLVSGIVYYAFMAAWLNAFLLLGVARWIQVMLGGTALVLGGLNVKDAFWMGHGPSLGIPDAAKPGIYARVRRVVSAERLGPALAGVAVLAMLVNTVELLCTAGLPALFTRILTMRDMSVWAYHGYLALYNVCYMLDDALILTIAVVTLSQRRLQAGWARWLKLLSGAVMLGLGAMLLLEPDWLVGG